MGKSDKWAIYPPRKETHHILPLTSSSSLRLEHTLSIGPEPHSSGEAIPLLGVSLISTLIVSISFRGDSGYRRPTAVFYLPYGPGHSLPSCPYHPAFRFCPDHDADANLCLATNMTKRTRPEQVSTSSLLMAHPAWIVHASRVSA